jgi:uncharacterized membrane protein
VVRAILIGILLTLTLLGEGSNLPPMIKTQEPWPFAFIVGFVGMILPWLYGLLFPYRRIVLAYIREAPDEVVIKRYTQLICLGTALLMVILGGLIVFVV